MEKVFDWFLEEFLSLKEKYVEKIVIVSMEAFLEKMKKYMYKFLKELQEKIFAEFLEDVLKKPVSKKILYEICWESLQGIPREFSGGMPDEISGGISEETFK